MKTHLKRKRKRGAIFLAFIFFLMSGSFIIIQIKDLSFASIFKPKDTFRIVIDAGHGGKDPGAEGASGAEEKEFTLAVAKRVYDLLKQEPKFDPYLTRTDDTFIELEDRANYANDLDADIFISIHGNTYKDPKVTGTETFYYNEESIELADIIHGYLVDANNFVDRSVKQEDWKVLTHSNMPAILLEIGYLTNKKEEASMLSKSTQKRTAEAIVAGLKEYFYRQEQS